MNVTRELLAAMPKAELHVHLDGSLRPRTMVELAREAGTVLPVMKPDALGDYMHVRDARDLVDYLARFETTLALMQTAPAIERIAYELAEDCAAENVRYLEVRYCPALNVHGGLSMHEVVEASLRGLQRAERAFPIRTAVIICGLRSMDPQVSLELAQVAVDFKDKGVVAYDLAGGEKDNPPKLHRAAFYFARKANMAVTVHAGEAYGPASISQAIRYCGANRIGHGTRLFEDADLMRYVRDFRIPLEICLTSNVQTRAVATFEDHPLRRYLEEDIVVTLNTDNRLMSATTVTEEYWRAHQHQGLDWDELCRIAIMGFEAAFLPLPDKKQMVADAKTEIANLGKPLDLQLR
jgi:adenosine deaminase